MATANATQKGRLRQRPLWIRAPGNSPQQHWLVPFDPDILGKRVTTLLHYDIEERNFSAEPEYDSYPTGRLGVC